MTKTTKIQMTTTNQANTENAASTKPALNKLEQAQPGEMDAKTLRETVSKSLERYFSHMDDHQASNIYDMVIGEVEPSLFEAVLKHTKGNQSKAAAVLGLNRGTLRKKLKQYDIA